MEPCQLLAGEPGHAVTCGPCQEDSSSACIGITARQGILFRDELCISDSDSEMGFFATGIFFPGMCS